MQGNLQIQTGYTYQNTVYDDLLTDPFVSGNINLGPLLSTPIVPLTTLDIGSLTSNQSYYNYSSNGIYSTDAKIKLGTNGIELDEGCDLTIGNRSLKSFMTDIEQRLALLQVNPALEKEWAELKELGDKYRQLEKDIKEKMKTWDILSRNDVAEQKVR